MRSWYPWHFPGPWCGGHTETKLCKCNCMSHHMIFIPQPYQNWHQVIIFFQLCSQLWKYKINYLDTAGFRMLTCRNRKVRKYPWVLQRGVWRCQVSQRQIPPLPVRQWTKDASEASVFRSETVRPWDLPQRVRISHWKKEEAHTF